MTSRRFALLLISQCGWQNGETVGICDLNPQEFHFHPRCERKLNHRFPTRVSIPRVDVSCNLQGSVTFFDQRSPEGGTARRTFLNLPKVATLHLSRTFKCEERMGARLQPASAWRKGAALFYGDLQWTQWMDASEDQIKTLVAFGK